jgi:hypothetical protein
MQIQFVRSITARRIAYGTSLAALISILAVAIVLTLTRQTSAPAAAVPVMHPAQSMALGIARPAGVDVREWPSGYSDYFLPQSGNAAAKPRSMQLGIARPSGVDVRTLPTGYSDYFLPETVNSSIPAQSMQVGIARPSGVDVRSLPSGYSDYFLPNDE